MVNHDYNIDYIDPLNCNRIRFRFYKTIIPSWKNLISNSIIWSVFKVNFVLNSSRMPARKISTNDGVRGPGSLPQIQRDIPPATNPIGTWGTSENLRWHSWTVHGFTPPVRIRRLPSGSQLSLSRRLRRSRQTVPRDDMPPSSLQDQVSGELLLASWQSRVCFNQQDLWFLWRM